MQEVRVQGRIPAPAVGEGLLGEVLVYAVLRRGRWGKKRTGWIFKNEKSRWDVTKVCRERKVSLDMVGWTKAPIIVATGTGDIQTP